MNESDRLPRIFQANVDRFYQRVIRPGLEALPINAELRFGEAPSIEDFVDWATAQTENYTANEGAKAYALALAGLFERQLRIWARSRSRDPVNAAAQKTVQLQKLMITCAEEAAVDLVSDDLEYVLYEMFLVANVFRHGDGPSAVALQSQSPHLWTYDRSRYVDILPPCADMSEKVLLQPDDLKRYATGCVRFWGRADKQPGAIADPYDR